MIFGAPVSIATLVGLALLLAVPAEAAENQKRSNATCRAQDPNCDPSAKKSNRIVVRPRSYLSAGTETKQYDEHYTDYAFPPGGSWDYQNRNNFQDSFSGRPFFSPWDIPGWPKY
ncbi:MAG: hypothetical protein ACXWKA_11335 [Xanthobacteraceae bacterium]